MVIQNHNLLLIYNIQVRNLLKFAIIEGILWFTTSIIGMYIFVIEDDFFITNDTIVTTTTCTSRANDVRHKNDKRKPVSCHSSKHLPLNSLFLHSLGDDSGCYSASLVIIIF